MEWMSLAGCHCECLYGSRTILLLSRLRAYGTSRSILLDFRNREERMESKIELPDDLGDDLMVGIDVIAAFLKQPRRRVQHWADTGALPLRKTGNLWTGTKSALRRHFDGGDR
jgi:hypothetical protein